MSKISIKLIMLGHIDKIIDFNLVQKHKSELFIINDLDRINYLQPSSKNDGYLDISYSKEEITKILSEVEFDDICIGIMNYKFEDNFYMHRLGDNKVCISISGLEQILLRKNISLENFILKNIYEMSLFYKIFNSKLSEDLYEFVHEDTRGCLFDLNGDKNDIIYNTEKPILCNKCLSKINEKNIPNNLIPRIKEELKKIKKPYVKEIELFIKKYPLLSIGLTVIFSISINLISNLIWALFF